MSLKQRLTSDDDDLDQLAGLTGVGWTVSVLGYLGTLVGYGNSVVARLVADPQSLLYLGGALFVTTLGLDRLQRRATDRDERAGAVDGDEGLGVVDGEG